MNNVTYRHTDGHPIPGGRYHCEPLPISAPAVGTPVPTFAEAGLPQPTWQTEGRRIYAIRPWTLPLDSTAMLEHVSTCIWGSLPPAASGEQIRQHAPHVKIPTYFLDHVALTDDTFGFWSDWATERGIDPQIGILAPIGQIDGSERWYSNVFNDDYREWAFLRAKSQSEKANDGLLADLSYNDVPPAGTSRDAWQHAVGSLLREIYKHHLAPKGKTICCNISNFRADRPEIISRYVGGLYLDRLFIKSTMDASMMHRNCVWNEEYRRDRWMDDYWSIQDSHAAGSNTPEWKMGDYCRWLLRMSVLGGWHGRHFFALRNNDASGESHCAIEAEHSVPAAINYPIGEPLTPPVWHAPGVLRCTYEHGMVFSVASAVQGGGAAPAATITFPDNVLWIGYTGLEGYKASIDLQPGEGVIAVTPEEPFSAPQL